MRQVSSNKKRLLILLLAIAAMSIAAVACGSDESSVGAEPEGPIAKIDATDRIYNSEDIKAVTGFKLDDDYDVEGLDDAVEAIYGFYGPDPYSRLEYEVRFYADHATAMSTGVSFADEATGADAVVLKDIQRWDEGITDRRQCAGNGGHHSGKCDNPKYFDYIVVGNMIMMCQGKDTPESLTACAALMDLVQ